MMNTPQSHQQLACDICYLPYNRTNRQPLLLCPRSHLVCSECIRQIRKKKQCPFCRTPLDLSHIRIDYSVLRQLAPDPQDPNYRYRKQQPEFFELTPQSSSVSEDSDIMNEGLLLELEQNLALQHLYQLEETLRKRTLIFMATLFFLVPFAALDIYYGFFYKTQPQCTSFPRLFNVITPSQWFTFIGSVEGLYLLIYLASQVRRKCGGEYQLLYLNALEEIYSMGLAVKAIFCCVVQLCLFFGVVTEHCRGPFYGYNVVLCCLHITKIVMAILALLRNWCC